MSNNHCCGVQMILSEIIHHGYIAGERDKTTRIYRCKECNQVKSEITEDKMTAQCNYCGSLDIALDMSIDPYKGFSGMLCCYDCGMRFSE